MRLRWLVIPLFFASSVAQASELTAVLVEVEGMVTVTQHSSPSASRFLSRPLVRRALPLQVVRLGDALRVPAGARVGLVCSTDRWVLLLSGKGERRLDDKVCSAGQTLPPGVYRSLAPEAGRLRSVRGAIVLERQIRRPEDEDGRIPLLLEPRDTAVLDGRPAIRWTRVKEATDYLIEVTGDVSFRAHFDASDVACGSSPGWGESEICSVRYPESSPELPPGAVVHLAVAARRGIANPWYRESDNRRVGRLPAAQAAEVRARLRLLADLPVGEMARQLLAADLYAGEGLLANALDSYREAGLRLLPEVEGGVSWRAAEILVTLGDTYFATGLLAPAAWSYEMALRVSKRPLIMAAAGFGLGHVEYVRGSFESACDHFLLSRNLYMEQGLAEEAAAAERALVEAHSRVPQTQQNWPLQCLP